MRLTFHLFYPAPTGHAVQLVSRDIATAAGADPAAGLLMTSADGAHWSLTVDVPTSLMEADYAYQSVDADGQPSAEPWRPMRHVAFDFPRATYTIHDRWQTVPDNSPLYTSAFTRTRFARSEPQSPIKATYPRCLVLRVPAPRVGKDEHVAIVGSCDSLGHWDPAQAVRMSDTQFPDWEVCLDLDTLTFPLEYKFIIRDASGQVRHWEDGYNRTLEVNAEPREYEIVTVTEEPIHVNRPGWKGAGTVIPVFSLRSKASFGVGDLHDLRLLVDWAAQTGQCVVQVLPMNDTTAKHTRRDSYPYSAISVYALHPMYISLPDMGDLKDKRQMTVFRRMQRQLNALPEMDYETVVKEKSAYCRAYFRESGAKVMRSAGYRRFVRENRAWLMPYAAFCYYRDLHGTADFTRWGDDARYDADRVSSLFDAQWMKSGEVGYHCFLQYILHTQFSDVANYARRRGVILKGDLPIGVNRASVDAWADAPCFNPQQQAGAPPDDFSVVGQNWGFPTYNWEVMERDGFAWWKARLKKLSEYFDCFRIDHILGFFRIWEIPLDYVRGLCGHFRPALPFTADEIEAFGLPFDGRYTRPMIRREHLTGLFCDEADELAARYLTPIDDVHFAPNALCDTQRKIAALFQNADDDDHSRRLRDALYSLTEEVLFLEDPYAPGHYHPRISADRTLRYRTLTEQERAAFDRLYADFFFVRHHDFWRDTALRRLRPLTASTDMLVCGEDLGMIPDSVHEVMDRLRILSLELGRISKIYGVEFTDLGRAPYLSVCTTSTHDMSPLRLWWQEDTDRTRRYLHALSAHDSNPEDALPDHSPATPNDAERMVRDHLEAASILTILPLQDWLAMDGGLRAADPARERINIPANPAHYWRYRMHLTLEALLEAEAFNKKIGAMLRESNRTDL